MEFTEMLVRMDSALEFKTLFLFSGLSVVGVVWNRVRGLSLQEGGLHSALRRREFSCEFGCTAADSGTLLKIFSWFSIRISMTMFWNLMSMMAATVSSWGRSKVGPNTTPRLATVIRFSW